MLNKKNISTVNFIEYSSGANDSPVLLLSSESNAEGINLSMFDKLIIFEPFEDHMYSKEIEKQLIGRIHRVGRIKRVDVFRLITNKTIEEEIYSQFAYNY
jgi:SNF2 family DNA or RNA helicase